MIKWKKVTGTKTDDIEEEEDDATVDPNQDPNYVSPTIDSSTGTVDTSTGSNSGSDDIPTGNG